MASSPLPDADKRLVIGELEEVFAARRVRRPSSRLLLEVLHAGRALDTALGAYVESAGVAPPHALGETLHHLASWGVHGHRWPGTVRAFYESRIVQPRNRFLRQAGGRSLDPSEIETLLNDIEACLAEALALW